MFQDFKELLSALNDHNVRYLVVGSYEVGLHAEPRATKDLEVFIRADQENSEAVFRALAAYGAPLSGYTATDLIADNAGFQIGMPPLRIDILHRLEAVPFDEAWASRVETLMDGHLPAHVISRAHLIRNKLAFARPRDILDVQALRESDPDLSPEDTA